MTKPTTIKAPTTFPTAEKTAGYIMIVESDGIIGMDLEKTLERSGYKTRLTSCNNCFLAAQNAPMPELIIAEKNFYCGSHSCSLLESVLANKKIPVIFISDNSVAEPLNAYGLNLLGVFHKSFDIQEIIMLMDEHFS